MKNNNNFYILLFTPVLFLLSSCKNEIKNVKILEEKDPMVKIIEEKDSMVIYKNDTIKKVIY